MRAHLDIRHEGTLDDDTRVRMQIDSDSTAFLMSILTDPYSDPELAVIREYSTNALDSHRASGNAAPIEIELPSTLRPLFIVRDYGVGLSVDEITHNFSKYGWSSKRDTDNEVGMLGLGCKAGLTYASQFTLVATKNGVRATVLITREADGAGAVQVIDTMCTSDPNGVEVQIPVKAASTFNMKADQFFRFWERGTVLVNGEAPTHILDCTDTLVLDPDVVISTQLACDYIVMGNVPYPVPNRILNNKWSVAAWVPIGAVDFTPSREALHMTKRTKEVLATLNEFARDALHRVAQADIDAAPTHWEGLLRRERWSGVASRWMRRTYRGDEIPYMPVRVDKDRTLEWIGPRLEDASIRPTHINIQTVESSVFLVGHNGRAFTRADKERMLKWLAANDLPLHTTVIALPELPGSPWFDAKARVVTLDELRGFKVDVKVAPVAKTANGYRVLSRHGDIVYVKELAEQVVWIPAAMKVTRTDLMNFFCQFDVSVVPVPKGQEARFLAENPKAMPAKTFVEALAYLFVTSAGEGDIAKIIMAHEIEKSGIRNLKKVRSQIHDPELVELIDLCASSDGTAAWWRTISNACAVFEVPTPKLEKNQRLVNRLRAVRDRYPLIEWASELERRYDLPNSKLADFVRYINLTHFSET